MGRTLDEDVSVLDDATLADDARELIWQQRGFKRRQHFLPLESQTFITHPRSARPHRLLRRSPRRPLEDLPRARLPPRGGARPQHPVAARGRRHPGELKVPGKVNKE